MHPYTWGDQDIVCFQQQKYGIYMNIKVTLSIHLTWLLVFNEHLRFKQQNTLIEQSNQDENSLNGNTLL